MQIMWKFLIEKKTTQKKRVTAFTERASMYSWFCCEEKVLTIFTFRLKTCKCFTPYEYSINIKIKVSEAAHFFFWSKIKSSYIFLLYDKLIQICQSAGLLHVKRCNSNPDGDWNNLMIIICVSCTAFPMRVIVYYRLR